MTAITPRSRLNVVIAGHVDHGKSTVAGRLASDTGNLPQGKLDSVRGFCEQNSRPFEYAFLLDALKEERSQGITIDAARMFLRTARRDYLIIDAPGHSEFIKNMVSGASSASAALLVIDAEEGVRENSRRHGYLLSMLGISQIAVLVNKMDLVGYRQEVFQNIAAEYAAALAQFGIAARVFIPTAAALGENISLRAVASMPWYSGPSTLDALEAFPAPPAPIDGPVRMPVQDVYRFEGSGDERPIVAGTVESGSLRAGDEMVFYPSGKTSVIKALQDSAAGCAGPGQAVGFTLTETLDLRRGEVAARRGETPPHVSQLLRASVFWFGGDALRKGRDYQLKLGTARVVARLEEVARVVDTCTLEVQVGRDCVERNEAGECILRLQAPLAFEKSSENLGLGRFVLVADYEICGAGLVREPLGVSPPEGDLV